MHCTWFHGAQYRISNTVRENYRFGIFLLFLSAKRRKNCISSKLCFVVVIMGVESALHKEARLNIIIKLQQIPYIHEESNEKEIKVGKQFNLAQRSSICMLCVVVIFFFSVLRSFFSAPLAFSVEDMKYRFYLGAIVLNIIIFVYMHC